MPTLPPVPDPRIGPALRDAFLAADYRASAVSALLGPVAEHALARGEPAAARRASGGGSSLETLVRLFLLAEPVPTQAAVAALGPLAVDDGVLVPDREGRLRAALDLRPYGDQWYVASDLRRPGGGAALAPDAVVGIGSASVTLVTATPRPPVRTALDLGTGCGVQALHLAAAGAAVTATDRSERALQMAALTAALSGSTIELIAGDLFAPVAGRRFDQVVANPPFVIGPNRFTYRDNPLPADELTARVVRSAADHLEVGGTATLLGSWLELGDADWQQRVGSWLPAGCDALVLRRERLDPAEHVALWLADGDESADAEASGGLADQWLADLERQHAQGVGYGLVLLRRLPDGETEPWRRFLDVRGEPDPVDGARLQGWLDRVTALRRSDPRQLRLQRAAGLSVQRTSVAHPDGWLPAGVTLHAPGALPNTVAVNEPVVSVVSECDPSLPLGAALELVGAGTGNPHLVEDGPAAVVELVEAGMLVPG